MSPSHLEYALGIAVGLTTLAAAAAAWFRWIYPRYKNTRARVISALDALTGREAIVDTITGRELAPALPGIGQRMDTVEQTLIKLADQQTRIDDHETRLSRLEIANIERTVTRAESLQHLTTLDQAIRRIPEPDEDPDDPDAGR